MMSKILGWIPFSAIEGGPMAQVPDFSLSIGREPGS
jgi:hypothetical protein